jgi:hypothetical protein
VWIAIAHRALPLTPEAERQHWDEKNVKGLKTPDPVRALWYLAPQAKVVAVRDHLAHHSTDAIEDDQF